jgi:hypothetical protein
MANDHMPSAERLAYMESSVNHLQLNVHELFKLVHEQYQTSSNLIRLIELNQVAVKHEGEKINKVIPLVDKLWDMRSQFKGGWSSAATFGVFLLGFINTVGVLFAIFHK